MAVQESIEKLLNALAEDTALQEKIKKDPENTVRAFEGLGLQDAELENLVKGTTIIYSDKNHGMGFNALLAVKSCIPGLAELLAEQKRRLDITYFTDEVLGDDCMNELLDYFENAKSDDMAEAMKEYGDIYKEEELRLARIVFRMNSLSQPLT